MGSMNISTASSETTYSWTVHSWLSLYQDFLTSMASIYVAETTAWQSPTVNTDINLFTTNAICHRDTSKLVNQFADYGGCLEYAHLWVATTVPLHSFHPAFRWLSNMVWTGTSFDSKTSVGTLPKAFSCWFIWYPSHKLHVQKRCSRNCFVYLCLLRVYRLSELSAEGH